MSAPAVFDTSVVSHYLADKGDVESPLRKRVREALEADAFAISVVSVFEIRRGLEALRLRGDGIRKIARTEMFLRSVPHFSLDVRAGTGWAEAARLWARGRHAKPAVVLSDADLLIATTAWVHRVRFVTADAKLAERLGSILVHLPVEVV